METFVEAGHSTGGHALILLLLLLYNPGLDTLGVYHVRRSIDQLIYYYYYYTRSNCVIIRRYLPAQVRHTKIMIERTRSTSSATTMIYGNRITA